MLPTGSNAMTNADVLIEDAPKDASVVVAVIMKGHVLNLYLDQPRAKDVNFKVFPNVILV